MKLKDRITIRTWPEFDWILVLDKSPPEVVKQALREYNERLRLVKEWKILIVRDVTWDTPDSIFLKE